MATTPRTASTSDARKRQAERDHVQFHGGDVTVGSGNHVCRPECVEPDAHVPADLPPVLPDTSGWVKREPGDVIEAGTPCVYSSPSAGVKYGVRPIDYRVDETDGDWWTPPPAPAEPWRVISTDRDKPTLAKVTFGGDMGVVGEWWSAPLEILRRMDDPGEWVAGAVTDVELLHTYDPVTHVPVERALVDEAARWNKCPMIAHQDHDHRNDSSIVAALAALADGAQS